MLFDRNIKTIGKHITNVFNEKELDLSLTVANFKTVEIEGEREILNITIRPLGFSKIFSLTLARKLFPAH